MYLILNVLFLWGLLMKDYEKVYNIALAGNPNVGKSTIFNSLTGLHQHTGNWPGKTVENTQGEFVYNDALYMIQDLPGTYSLVPNSAEEEVTCDYIKSGEYDALVIILDASCIKRNLRFAVQILQCVHSKAIVCINLIDEAKKKGIEIDTNKLSKLLGIPVIPTAARNGVGLAELKTEIENIVKKDDVSEKGKINLYNEKYYEKIFFECCNTDNKNVDKFDRKIDNFLISKKFGIPIMLFILIGIFWLTIVGANYPSEWLNSFFQYIGALIENFLIWINCPAPIISAVVDGIYTTLTWIISVMLPPMAIFFPLFTLMEDSGYLPRIAFNLDSYFRKANAHGKQSLTIAMGFGCNACGVTGCRIIDSPRERLIAIITNSLVPCNGRFPTLISIISMFFVGALSGISASFIESGILLLLIVLSVFVTLLCSKLLSKTLLKGVPSSFVLELPPYRRPQIGKVIVRSVFDRTLYVLFRAIVFAAPAGLLIWILANVHIGDMSILAYCTEFLDPIGRIIGLDGAILMAFILGFPANEIVLPIILMIYMSSGSISELPDLVQLKDILVQNGWTLTTAICTSVFVLFHFPCSTTCMTIFKETKSKKWTVISFFLPLLIGTALCLIINLCSKLLNFLF